MDSFTSFTTPICNRLPRKSVRFEMVPFEHPVKRDPVSRDELIKKESPDITFQLNNTHEIMAHTRMLAKASSVFNTMLFGDFERSSEIEVEGVDISAFELVLQAIYLDCTVFINASIDICIQSFLIADKYNLTYIERYLSEHLHKQVDANNAFEILLLAKHVSIPHVLSKCWSVIERNTKKSISSPKFLLADFDILCDVLENDHLTIREFDLAVAVWGWCKNQRKTVRRWANSTLIEILGVAVYKIRFPLMTTLEFDLVCSNGMLVKEEIESLKKNWRNNRVYSRNKRRNACSCRRLSPVSCVLCMKQAVPKTFHFYQLDDNSNIITPKKADPGGLKSPNQNGANPAEMMTPSQSMNLNVKCHCQKYISCPAYPNGASARILFDKGLIQKF